MITRRILTMRSKLGRGTYAGETVERLIAADMAKAIRSAYYHYEEIDLADDVKAAAGIFITIAKPGTGRDKYIDNERMCRKREREALGEDAYLRKVMPVKAYRTRQEWARRTSARLDGLGRAGIRQALNHGKLKAKPYDL